MRQSHVEISARPWPGHNRFAQQTLCPIFVPISRCLCDLFAAFPTAYHHISPYISLDEESWTCLHTSLHRSMREDLDVSQLVAACSCKMWYTGACGNRAWNTQAISSHLKPQCCVETGLTMFDCASGCSRQDMSGLVQGAGSKKDHKKDQKSTESKESKHSSRPHHEEHLSCR